MAALSTTPARATVTAGTTLLIGASAALGTYFGFQTGSHHHALLGLIFGGAALGGELLKPFAVAAALDALRRLDILRGVACLAVGLVCVVYSLASELALSAGSRGDLAASREAQSDALHAAREKRQRAIDEMAGMKPTRSVAELEALISAASSTSARRTWHGCQVRVSNGVRDMVCPPPPALLAELGRAKRKAELETVVASAEKAMAGTGHVVKDADPLAAAVAYYLNAAGWKTAAETVSPWLYLLPVLFLELGSALGLVVAGTTAATDKPADGQTEHREAVRTTTQITTERPADQAQTTRERTVHSPVLSTRDRLLAMVRDAKGPLRTGHRALGEALGVSATRAGQLLRDLVADGLVRVRTSKTGSVVTLVPKVVGVTASG